MEETLNAAADIIAKKKEEILNTHKLWELVPADVNKKKTTYDGFLNALKSDQRFTLVQMKDDSVLQVLNEEHNETKIYPLVYLISNPPDRELALSTLEKKIEETHDALLKGWQTLPKESNELQQDIMIKLLSQVQKIKNELGELKSKLSSPDKK